MENRYHFLISKVLTIIYIYIYLYVILISNLKISQSVIDQRLEAVLFIALIKGGNIMLTNNDESFIEIFIDVVGGILFLVVVYGFSLYFACEIIGMLITMIITPLATYASLLIPLWLVITLWGGIHATQVKSVDKFCMAILSLSLIANTLYEVRKDMATCPYVPVKHGRSTYFEAKDKSSSQTLNMSTGIYEATCYTK